MWSSPSWVVVRSWDAWGTPHRFAEMPPIPEPTPNLPWPGPLVKSRPAWGRRSLVDNP